MRLALVLLLLAAPAAAQEAVRPVPDVASWATAAANPGRAVWQTFRAENQTCEFIRLGLSAALINGTVLIVKAVTKSPRPCTGCARDGMPSGHEANSWIGSGLPWGTSRGWSLTANVSLGALTGILRHEANRHTWPQIAVGAGIGIGGEWAARRIVRCE